MSHTTTVTWPTSEVLTTTLLKQKLAEHPVDLSKFKLSDRKTGPHPADPRHTIDVCTWDVIPPPDEQASA